MKRLIEQWFPTAQIGAESLRERGSAAALPPINFMHVWWARRPLAASRAAVILSLLPAWPKLEPESDADRVSRDKLSCHFPNGEPQYHSWVLRALGVLGDSAAHRKKIAIATEQGVRAPYGYMRAFTVTPDSSIMEIIRDLIGDPLPKILDPFSGGGSIPFEALRYGLPTMANELNPVAVAILTATIDLPFRFGVDLAKHIKTYGDKWAERVAARLTEFFPQQPNASKISYIWARTVACPTTGHPTPLAPNYWLANDAGKAVALELISHPTTGTISFKVHSGSEAKVYGNRTTYKGGVATSVWTGESFDSDYIRNQGINGKLGTMLLAIAEGNNFRTPTQTDLNAIAAAERELARLLPEWEARDLVPFEELPLGFTTEQPKRVGVNTFRQMFTDRQLLVNVTILEELRRLIRDATSDLGEELGKALALYLAISFDRCVDYNSSFTMWDCTRNKIAHVFTDHNFACPMAFAEFEGARELVPWVVKHTITNYTKLLKLLPAADGLFGKSIPPATIISGSATDMFEIADASVDAIVTDPPYYENVFYAESSDFFYVWLKRALRESWPEFCTQPLTDKDREAVANRALFKQVATRKGAKKKGDTSKSASELADSRYEELMTQAFREAHRILRPDGIMTIMFTNKRVDAWDSLGKGIINAGFTIESSWPVATESQHALTQAKKNAANATIFLTCRKRVPTAPVFWPDIKPEITRITQDSVKRFADEGITGVDLTLACYGPALSVISRNWPVYTGDADPTGKPIILEPDIALELARATVAEIKKRGLLGGRNVDFDRPTDWWLIAWSDFKAREFSSGEALKLCQAMHLDLTDLAKSFRLIHASKGTTVLLSPAQRRAKRSIDPSDNSYKTLVDALHALMLIYTDEGLATARDWLERTKLKDNDRFIALIRAAIHAIPRTKLKGKFVVEEAATLESLRATLFESAIAEPKDSFEQLALV